MAKAKTARTPTPDNKQVITMPEVSSTPQIRKTVSPAVPTPIDMEAQIRQRAFELFQERGAQPGHENEDWFRAEQEVRARHNHQQRA